MKKYFLILLILIVATGIVAVIQLPAILSFAGDLWLRQKGMDNVEMSITSIGKHQSEINRIGFRSRLEGVDVSLSAENISFGYKLSDLSYGFVERLYISKLALQVDGLGKSNKTSSGQGGDLSQALTAVQSVLSEIPIREIDIDQVILDGKPVGRLEGKASMRSDLETRSGLAKVTMEPVKLGVEGAGGIEFGTIYPRSKDFVEIKEGLLKGAVEISWGQVDSVKNVGAKAALSGELIVSSLSGKIKDFSFEGLNGKVQVLLGPDGTEVVLNGVQIAHVELPVPVGEISFDAKVRLGRSKAAPEISIPKISATALGAMISARETKWIFNRDTNSVAVNLIGLDLTKLLALYPQEHISGSGIIDGDIPIVVANGAAQVRDGKLKARAPGGVIRYLPNGDTDTPPSTPQSLQIVQKALQNYHYDSLDVGVEYEASGKLLLKASFKGRNPDFNNGQEVNLNLQLEENIPALLKSLSVAENIESGIR